ncbi:DUF1688-domain-containing protein [Clavulina sp. PMI_390]|nr:DUF1688-domain-containing protein [Clavulina sp. PMI_390]
MNLSINEQSSPGVQAAYLQTLPAIRERCTRVFDLAKEGKLEHFDYHQEHESAVIDFCVQIIQRDFGSNYASASSLDKPWYHVS